MASHESALKAHRQNVKQRERNRQLRTRLRSALRDIRAAIDAGTPDDVKDALRQTISLVDKMAGKGLIHRNTAGRYKSRLAARVSRKSASGAGLTDVGPRSQSPAQLHHEPLEEHPRVSAELLRSRSVRNSASTAPGNAPRVGHCQLFPHEPRELTQDHVGHAARLE